jgi:uncharacterized YccA/Bax inhibitor family protein
MESRNPVMRHITENEGQAGFAFDEGKAAYAQAGTETAGTPAAQSAATLDDLKNMYDTPGLGTGRLGIDDVLVKTAVTFVVLVIGAVGGWNLAPSMPWLLWVAMFVGLGLAFANTLMKRVQPVLVLAYALIEGVFVGGISWAYNELALAQKYEGIVQQAVLGTLVAFAVMLVLYRTGVIKVTQRFRSMMMIGLFSYLAIGLVSLVAALFGVGGGWGFYGVGALGIALCALGVALASFSLVLDFEAITQAVRSGAPERESWRLAFALLVTLVWLYLELLRLIAIIASANR